MKARIVLVNSDVIAAGRDGVRGALQEFVYSVFGEGHYHLIDRMSNSEVKSMIAKLFTESKDLSFALAEPEKEAE